MDLAATVARGVLDRLADEVLLLVFEYLDITSLESCKGVCVRWRRVAQDRRLQTLRLRGTRWWLEAEYARRPSVDELYARNILLSRVQLAPTSGQQIVVRVTLERFLVKERLVRGLAARPARTELMRRGILREGGPLAGAVIAVNRARAAGAIRAVYSDGGHETWMAVAIERGILTTADVVDMQPAGRPSVGTLVRKFSAKRGEPVVSAQTRRSAVDPPPRAQVLRLRRQFEDFANEPAPSTRRPPLQQQRTGIQPGIVASLCGQFATLVDGAECRRPLVRQYTGVTAGLVRRLRQQFLF
jgi:hypothetical protein